MPTAMICVTKDCPLDCSYCYVHNKEKGVININLLKKFINSLFLFNQTKTISILWHGGEPLTAGTDFFKEICNYIEIKFPGIKVIHRLQTSGWLINDEWCKLFKDNNFRVGISLDGPQKVHDIHRKTKGNKLTFYKIFDNIKLLENYGLKLGFGAVVTKETQKYATEVFNFFKENNWNYDFTYVIANSGAEFYLTPKEYIDYYKSVFKLFLSQKGDNKIKIRIISHNIFSFLKGRAAGLCSNQPNCAEEFVSITPDGNICNCNRFANYPSESYGNLNHEKFDVIMKSEKRKQFYLRQKYIEKMCAKCEYLNLCNGGCPFVDYIISKNIFSKKTKCEINKGIYGLIKSYLRKELL